MDRFQRAIERFDALNAQDPRTTCVDGENKPRELVYGQRMSAMLASFAPDASEALRLAARCQHIQRWALPRDRYPMTRPGYHRWRSELKALHAKIASEVLGEVGYEQPVIDEVASLLKKRGLGSDPASRDPQTQTLEDVVCLVFLRYELEGFAEQHDATKVVDILRKTWPKMSTRGQEAALTLPLAPACARLVSDALSAP